MTRKCGCNLLTPPARCCSLAPFRHRPERLEGVFGASRYVSQLFVWGDSLRCVRLLKLP
jgi:hypothetical protein